MIAFLKKEDLDIPIIDLSTFIDHNNL